MPDDTTPTPERAGSIPVFIADDFVSAPITLQGNDELPDTPSNQGAEAGAHNGVMGVQAEIDLTPYTTITPSGEAMVVMSLDEIEAYKRQLAELKGHKHQPDAPSATQEPTQDAPSAPTPHIPTARRPGRSPALTQAQVAEIMASDETQAQLAARYGVSRPTIRMVKNGGYISREAYDRQRAVARPSGRPYKKRKEPLSDHDKLNIIVSNDTQEALARAYGVGVSTISRLRTASRRTLPIHTTGPLAGQRMTLPQAVLADQRDDAQVARAYNITPAMVRHIREN